MKILILLIVVCLCSACSTFTPVALDYGAVTVNNSGPNQAPENTGRTMEYGVYTPPNWQLGESLPIILFLHGGGGSHTSFEKYGGAAYLDQQITAGKIPRVIIVTPNGNNGFWENWADGSFQYRDWVLQDVFPEVQQKYQTLTCPEHCHLAGISMGGFGVLRMAYLTPGTFASVSSISAPIYSDEQANERASSLLTRLFFPLERIFGEDPDEKYRKGNPYNAWVDDEQLQKMRLQLIWGDQDHRRIKQANEYFHQHLVKNKVEHDSYVYDGRHKWVDWIPNLDRVINFLLLTES
ncbi:MAG: esterase family protein [Acidiferrobacterales bacterium]|nr:esterase family protein [Acidiferrobacterales bacterium]